ncbi:MAG: response regulator, partial [Saprospiraceae bacterium]
YNKKPSLTLNHMTLNIQDSTSVPQASKRLVSYEIYSKVLLIEDNEADARLVEIYLEDADSIDCEIVHKTNLSDGLAALRKESFDAVLLDMNLPDSQGFETIEKLLSESPDANVLVLTGMEDKKFGINAVRSGAQDYLIKDQLDSNWLSKSLRYAIERNRATKRLEEAQRLARIGNWEFNILTEEMSISSEARRLLGESPKIISFGKDIEGGGASFFCEIMDLTKSQGSHQGDMRIVGGDDKEMIVFSKSSIIKNSRGDAITISGIIQDVTDRKRSEQFRKDRDLALESAKIKDELLANVSHEMRTPMNAILNMSLFALETDLTPQQEKDIRAIYDTSQHLLSIINDILEMSTLQKGKLIINNKAFDLPQLLSNLFNVAHYRLKNENLKFELELDEDVPRYVFSDSSRLHQVLINLVGNAFKFTEEGQVTVKVENIGSLENLWLKFSVEDTGIGIPENKLSDIFVPFGRVVDKKKNYPGTGLGLSISEGIVTAQNGGMGVISEVGKGSTFFFELPMKVASSKDVKDVLADEPMDLIQDKTPMKILLVEDDKNNSYIATRIINKKYPNIELVLAEDGEEALTEFNKSDFDLILMDLQMPIKDGYEATAEIRSHEDRKKANTTIIATTADLLISKGEKFKKCNMDDFLLKPYIPNQLFVKLTHYLNKKYK